jgi:hypothetical protein
MYKTTSTISKDAQDRLKVLSEYFNKDINEIVSEIIEIVSYESHGIIQRSEDYKIPVSLTNVFSHLSRASNLSTYSLFNVILDKLEGKGCFMASDMICDLDDTTIWIHFDGLNGSPLSVGSLDVWLKSGRCSMSISYTLYDIGEESDIPEKIQQVLEGETIREIVPEEFYALDDWNIQVEKEEEYVSLVLDVGPEYLGYVPTMPIVSSFFQKIIKTATNSGV